MLYIANGYADGEDTHVSVYIYLMRGDNNDNLKWPFKGTITVSLLNHLEDGQHLTVEVSSHESITSDCAGKHVIGRDTYIKHRMENGESVHLSRQSQLPRQ